MVICRTDDRVVNSRVESRASDPSSIGESATSTKSCLAPPGFLRRRKGKRGSAASTDQSSTGDHVFSPMAHNDRQKLLVQNSNQVTADWFEDEFHAKKESAVVTPTPAEPQASSSLLAFPAPRDRSHNARRAKNREQGAMHAYEGEMEPEGVRGQEATVTPPLEEVSEIPIRDFMGRSQPAGGILPVAPMESGSDEDSDGGHDEMVPFPDEEFMPNTFEKRNMENISATSSEDIQSMMHSEFHQQRSVRYPKMKTDGNSDNHQVKPLQFRPSEEHALGEPRGKYHRTTSNLVNENYTQPQQVIKERMTDSFYDSPDKGTRSSNSEKGHDHKVSRQSAPVNVDDSSFEDPLNHVEGINAMALEHVVRGEYDMALQAFSQVLTVYLETYGRAHPLTASAYHNLGTVHSKRAGLLLDNTMHQRHCREQALLCFQYAARSSRDSPQLGPSHPNVAVSLVRIGFLLLESRQYKNGVITFQEALRIRVQHYGPTHALVANLYNNLGVCHMHLQEFETGRRYLQQALDTQKLLLEEDDESTTALLELADTLCNIGGLCLEWIRQQGPDARHALDAESAFLEALDVRTRVLGEDHALTIRVRSTLDMVRSLPVPEVSDVQENHDGHTSPAISARNLTPENSIQSSPGRPYATSSTPPRSPSQIQATALSGGKSASDVLPLPSFESQETKATRTRRDPPGQDQARVAPSPPPGTSRALPLQEVPVPAKTLAPRKVHASESNTSLHFKSRIDSALSMQEASEDNFILDHSDKEDGQISVVSYSRSATSWTSSTQREKERAAYLMQAKAILDAHRNPTQANEGQNDHSTKSFRQNDLIEKRTELAPLGGDWPESSIDRITPEVLRNPSNHLRTIDSSANEFFRRGRFSEALHLLEIIVDVQRSKNGLIHEDVATALHNVGITELRLGENYRALQAFEEAVRTRKGALGGDHPLVAVSLMKVGTTLMLLGRLEDSLWIFREALSVREGSLGPMHPSTARIHSMIGCVHVQFKESKEAKRAFEQALEIQRNALEVDPENAPILFGTANTLHNLAYLYRMNRLHEEEAMVLRECFSIQQKVLGEHHPSVMSSLESLASACAFSGHDHHALKYYEECLERLYEMENENREELARIMYEMSKIHSGLNDRETQVEKLELASKILQIDNEISPEGADLEYQIIEDLKKARHQIMGGLADG